jgi:hypothetical protein
MLGGGGRDAYIGGLFHSGGYPVFSNDQCAQYVQEYLPFHLPQIEEGLRTAYNAVGTTFPIDRPVRVLDIGSGPASTALALDSLVSSNIISGRFTVDTVEPSLGFNRMIDRARSALASGPVEIGEQYLSQFPSWMQYDHSGNPKYDWIIMANALSPITLALNNDGAKLRSMITELLSKSGRECGCSATFIESGCGTYGHPILALKDLKENGYMIIGHGLPRTISAAHILKCRFYRTRQEFRKPELSHL